MIFNSLNFKRIKPGNLDKLLANGYRHFGSNFFRYSISEHENEFVDVIPLRINLKEFRLSKSQRRILKKNKDCRFVFSELDINNGVNDLFHIHKQKFKFGIPPSIHTFLGDDLNDYPCGVVQLSVYNENILYSVSFLDVGENSTSSIYGMYHPEYSNLSPGIFTMLKEIEYSIENNKNYYYSGYCYNVPSYYDYKKYFSGLEYYNWQGSWIPFEYESE